MSELNNDYVLSHQKGSFNIMINLKNYDYFAFYKPNDHVYIFERDQIIRKYKVNIDYKFLCYENYVGFSKNWDYFYFFNHKEKYLSLIELESKKEFLIELRENYESMKVNQYAALQANSSCIDFINFKTNNIIRFEQEKSYIQVSQLSKGNQYLIYQDRTYFLLIQHHGTKISIIQKISPFFKGYESFSNHRFFQDSFLLHFKDNFKFIRQYFIRKRTIRLVRKFYHDSISLFSEDFSKQNNILFLLNSSFKIESYLIDINLSNGTEKKIILQDKDFQFGQEFIFINEEDSRKINKYLDKAQSIVNFKEELKQGLIRKFK